MEGGIAALYNPIKKYVGARINNAHDAEDVTQDVFYKLAQADFDQIEKLENWLFSIAKNSVTDYYRKRKTNLTAIDTTSLIIEDKVAKEEADLSQCLVGFIDKLPEAYREIMTLAEIEHVPQKEIAERLNMNYTTLRSKVQRGRAKLKEMFSECCTIVQGGRGSIMKCVPIEKHDSCK